MGRSNNKIRSRDVAARGVALAKPKDGRVRDSRALRESKRRLSDGFEILRQSHSRTLNRKRSYVNTDFSLFPRVSKFGYHWAMTIRDAFNGALGAAFQHRLREVVERLAKSSSLKRIAEDAGIAYTTLRRFAREGETIRLENINRLYSLPGFMEAMKELEGEFPVAEIFDHTSEAMVRLQEIADRDGLERVLYSLESLTRSVGKENLPDILSAFAETTRKIAGATAPSLPEHQPKTRR